MDSYRLHKPDGTPLELWQCGKCGRVLDVSWAPLGQGPTDGSGKSAITYTHEQRLAHTAALAEKCCNYRCIVCGEKCDQFQSRCRKHLDEHWREQERQQEQAAFEKATERTDYNGPFVLGERYFEDMESLVDHYASEVESQEDWPEYVWVPRRRELSIDADGIVENALDDHAEDSADRIASEEMTELQTFLDGWCKRTGVVSFYEDHKEYVRIPHHPIEEAQRGQG